MDLRLWLRVMIMAAMFIAVLFGPAGTMAWPAAWVMLAEFFGGCTAILAILARENPALLAERLRSRIRSAGQPLWDQVLMAIFPVLFMGWLALMGLDAGRYGWLRLPFEVKVAGDILLFVWFWLMRFVLRANTFLIPIVRIQHDRGQTVVSTGPYAVVRHPMYSSMLLLFVAMPMAVGSGWGLVSSLALSALIILRTALEERTLANELEGYATYRSKVRYRLIPQIW